MRRLAIVTLLAAGYPTAAAPRGTDASAIRVTASAGISIRVPHGWNIVRGWLSDVLDPIPRLAIASFPARLSHHTCECGMPNVRDFPRAGAFVFIWEYPNYPAADLRRVPPRPTQFHVTQGNPHWYQCAGPSWETSLRASGRVFQIEVYLGPAAGPKVRGRIDAMLDSLTVTRLGSG